MDWYAWGPEAFDAARQHNKPIFLSVGYSTCYWCHVMERESFENEAIAREMNDRFINIKVDREARPDVDQLYMTAVQVLTRHGGWPMSVFLAPDLRPFYGGTYFPPNDSYGRPGFLTVLRAIHDAYINRHEEVERTATQLVDILQQISEPAPPDTSLTIDRAFLDRLVERSTSDYDPAHGGFGGAPKFPRQTLLELLLVYCSSLTGDVSPHASQRKPDVLNMVLHTLDALAAGGIRDQLGGGFHRYSTDARWLVPHFEIMLYDNAMLSWCYVEAYRQTEDLRYAEIARGVFDFVLREMTSPDGPFYTAFDAETDHREGATYLWSADEVRSILSSDARQFTADEIDAFMKTYGLDRGPNFADPHHSDGRPHSNILYLAAPIPDGMHDHFLAMRLSLYNARRQRKQPLLDTKIITSWNALMIRALSFGGQILNEPRYLNAASRAADWLLRHHRLPDGGLLRTTRPDAEQDESSRSIEGFLDDYAFLVQALVALRDATGLEQWKDHAAAIAMIMQEKFADAERGGFYFTARDAQDIIVRQKTASDSPLPSGNAVAAMSMLALHQPETAARILPVFSRQLRDQAEMMSSMVQAALAYVRQHGSIEVEASPEAPRTLTPEQIAAGVVALRASFTSPIELHLHVNILEGFHINAHTASPGLIPTTLTVRAEDIESIDYPPGQEQRLAFSDNPLRVYSDSITIAVRFRKPPPARSTIDLTLHYQACDDTACLPPLNKNLQITVP